MRTYIDSMEAMYTNALMQNGELYDIARKATDDFRAITAEAICDDSRIIKVLRYAVAPSISQMKFGQLFDLTSTDAFEDEKLTHGSAILQKLEEIAPKMATFVTDKLDKQRFIWVGKKARKLDDYSLASEYAKNWTCSIAADQNAQTRYRNWRKDQQEHLITTQLVGMGYIRSSFTGVVTNHTDIQLGDFTNERKVQGRTRQKADIVVRSKKPVA